MEEVPHFQNLKGEHKMENNAIMNNKVIETTEEVIENTGMSKGYQDCSRRWFERNCRLCSL